MKFAEAVQKHRQRNLLPEEQVIAEMIAEYDVISTYGDNHLEQEMVRLLAIDSGDKQSPEWRREIALLDCILSLAREVVEHRVRARAIIGQLTDLTYQHNQVVAELRGGAA